MSAVELLTIAQKIDAQAVERPNCSRPTISISPEKLLPMMHELHETFDMLLAHTVVDWKNEQRFELFYFLVSVELQEEIWVSVSIPRDTSEIDSVSGIWPIAEFHEREAYDMFGVKYRGHPDLKRIFLGEDWKGFPLRKDYEDSFMLVKPQVEKFTK